MVPIKAVAVSFFAPPAAIVAGALLQQILIWVWPGVQAHTILNLSLDTYFGAAAITCLTFWVGLGIRRSAPGRVMLIAAFIFPAIWLLLALLKVYPTVPLGALRVVFAAIAVAPVAGIGLAYALPPNNRWRGP